MEIDCIFKETEKESDPRFVLLSCTNFLGGEKRKPKWFNLYMLYCKTG